MKLAGRAPTCFPCKWILQDLSDNGRLTDWPIVTTLPGETQFPKKAKIAHLKVEGFVDFLVD